MTQPTNDEVLNQAPSRFLEAAGLRPTELSGTLLPREDAAKCRNSRNKGHEPVATLMLM
jgi:hypothetical protein